MYETVLQSDQFLLVQDLTIAGQLKLSKYDEIS